MLQVPALGACFRRHAGTGRHRPGIARLPADADRPDLSNAALPFMACAEMDIGLHRARVARLSVMGELGYEINRPSVEHRQLYKTLLDAGGDHGLVQVGFYAMGSL
ncbi:MAG: hypothetical protein KDK29_01305, partial [Sedimentitalea sp.]|nr:hypothetical protein [Sedimentitalea sp.]